MDNIAKNSNLDQTPDILLAYELVLIEKLHFHLVVHTAHRPFEGLIIDLKVRDQSFLSTSPSILSINLDALSP